MKKLLFAIAFLFLLPNKHAFSATLNIRVLIQGYYQGSGTMTAVVDAINYPNLCDTITVNLLDTTGSYPVLYSCTSVISTTGYGNFDFPNLPMNQSYFIQVVHRNALTVFSKYPVYFNTGIISYDFTIIPFQLCQSAIASGDGYAMMYSGDINQDGAIDSTDLNLLDSSMQQVVFGYTPADLTGDNVVEQLDESLIQNNIQLGLSGGHPYSCVALKATELVSENIAVYPNPSSGRFNIQSRSPYHLVEVSDIEGKRLISLAGQSFVSQMDLSGYAPGLYFLTIRDGEKEIHQKLVKE